MKGLASFISTSSFSYTCYSISKPKTQRFLQIRSQSFKDEGNSSNMVDANLGVLRARMEQLMKNESLEYTTPKTMKNIEWNQNNNNSLGHANYETQAKNGHVAMMTGTVEVMGLVGGLIGVVFLFGSLMILLVSVLVHLCS